ncbi:hypothetical protein GF327_07505 [Candidatus Woesearchaeota archaeon]|nr:hypothetical protein [Candidatus Woesearchaeota archaeon]
MATEDIKKEMDAIRAKKEPTTLEKLKLIRYYFNKLKYTEEKIFEELSSWNKQEVENIISDVKKENQKPRPKRYYVSLKEPLEDTRLR